MSGTLFKAVVQAVLLFGSETWVLSPCMGRTLGGFQHWVVRLLTGKQPWRLTDGRWEYPPLEEAMREAGLEEVTEYITWRQNKVTCYIATRTIMDLCEEAVKRPGTRVSKRWW